MTKRPEEIALLAESGRLLAQVFGHLDRLSLIGMSTMQVNDLVERLIVNAGTCAWLRSLMQYEQACSDQGRSYRA